MQNKPRFDLHINFTCASFEATVSNEFNAHLHRVVGSKSPSFLSCFNGFES